MYRAAVLLCLCLAVPGLGQPPAPVNVIMDSRNHRNLLRWSRPPGLSQHGDAMYTVEFKLNMPKQNYNMVCVTLDLYCDLTLVSHDSSVRVKAAARDGESEWVTISFNPSDHSNDGKLPPPANVSVDSVNLRNILRWSRPPGLGEDVDVTYRVQYQLHYDHSEDGIVHTSETRDLHSELYSANYKFYARVRAEVGANQSEWANISSIFDPYTDTVISPPELLVASIMGNLELSFYGPMMSDGNSIKTRYGELDYHVFYWKQSDPSNVMYKNTSYSSMILRDLEKWSTYCVRVQAYINDYEKSGEFSPVICKDTTDDGKVEAWKLALLFLGVMMFAMLMILAGFLMIRYAYRQYKSFPSYSIPLHLKEYLSTPFSGPPPLQRQPSRECVDCSSQLTFVSVEEEEQESRERGTLSNMPHTPL